MKIKHLMWASSLSLCMKIAKMLFPDSLAPINVVSTSSQRAMFAGSVDTNRSKSLRGAANRLPAPTSKPCSIHSTVRVLHILRESAKCHRAVPPGRLSMCASLGLVLCAAVPFCSSPRPKNCSNCSSSSALRQLHIVSHPAIASTSNVYEEHLLA